MTMAGATGKLIRRGSRLNMTGTPQEGTKEQRKLTRQGSTAALVSNRTTLSGTLKLLTDHVTTLTSLNEDTNQQCTAQTAMTNSSGNVDGSKRGKKVKKKTTKPKDDVDGVDGGEAARTTNSAVNINTPLSEQEVFTSLVIKTVQEALGHVYKDGMTEVSVGNVLPLLKVLDLDTSDESVLDLIRHSVIENSGKINSIDLDSVIMKSIQLNNHLDVEANVVAAFRLIDEDEDGYITQSDIRHLMTRLGEKLEDYAIDDMLEAVDIDQDGRISFKDFAYFLLGRYDLSYSLDGNKETRREFNGVVNTENRNYSEPQTQAPGTLVGEPLTNSPSTGVKQDFDAVVSNTPKDLKQTSKQENHKTSEARRMFFAGNFVLHDRESSNTNSGQSAAHVNVNIDVKSETSAGTLLAISNNASVTSPIHSRGECEIQITTDVSTESEVILNNDKDFRDLSESGKHSSERNDLSEPDINLNKSDHEFSSDILNNDVLSRTADNAAVSIFTKNEGFSKNYENDEYEFNPFEMRTLTVHVSSRVGSIGGNNKENKTFSMATSENVSGPSKQVERLNLDYDNSNDGETHVGDVMTENQTCPAAPMSSPTMSTGIGTMSGTTTDHRETDERLWELQSDTVTVPERLPQRFSRQRTSEDVMDGSMTRHQGEMEAVMCDMTFAVIEDEEDEEELPVELRYQESDEGIDLTAEIDSVAVSKPDYVQQWLSAPVVSLSDGADVTFKTNRDEPEVRDAWTNGDKFLTSRFGLAPDVSFSNSRSDLSDLHISLTSPRTDESFEEENAKKHSAPIFRISETYGKSRKPSPPSEDPNTSDFRVKSINDERVDHAKTRRGRNLRRHRTSLKSSARKCQQNKVALNCQKIEVQEMELNSPVTADLFSNRRKFGSLPRDVSKFIVFGKSSAGTENDGANNHQTKNWSNQLIRVRSPVRNKSESPLGRVLKSSVISETSRDIGVFQNGSVATERDDELLQSEDRQPQILYVKSPQEAEAHLNFPHRSVSLENRLLGRMRRLESRIMHRCNTVAGFQSLRDTNKSSLKPRTGDVVINTILNGDATRVKSDDPCDSLLKCHKKRCSVLDSLRVDTTSKKSEACENTVLGGECVSSPREKHVCSKADRSVGNMRMCYPSISRQLEFTGRTYLKSRLSSNSLISTNTCSATKELEETPSQSSYTTSCAGDYVDSSERTLLDQTKRVRPYSHNPTKRSSLLTKRASSSARERPLVSGRDAGAVVTQSSIVTLSLPDKIFYQRNMKSSHAPVSLI